MEMSMLFDVSKNKFKHSFNIVVKRKFKSPNFNSFPINILRELLIFIIPQY